MLRDLKPRGLTLPRLAVANVHLGIWGCARGPAFGGRGAALDHKTVNVLNALPKKGQPEAGERLSAMVYAKSRSACGRKRDEVILRFKKSDPKPARHSLTRDWERLVTFFDYAKEHWIHLRTTNIVESPFNAAHV